jgi:hypothetical protein
MPRSMFLQNPYDLELDFGYFVGTSMFRFCAKLCTKLLKGSFYINYPVILINLPKCFL